MLDYVTYYLYNSYIVNERENIMTSTQSIKAAIEASVHHHIDTANEKFNLSLDYPQIKYTVRGTCGGKASGIKWYVDFNMGLIVDNLGEYINQVVPHEVAHLVAYATNGYAHEYKHTRRGKVRVSHGARFYRIMRMFGVDETRTHAMDTSKVAQKRKTKAFPCKCTGCGLEYTIGTVRRNKILNGTKYKHRCGNGRTAYIQLTSHLPV